MQKSECYPVNSNCAMISQFPGLKQFSFTLQVVTSAELSHNIGYECVNIRSLESATTFAKAANRNSTFYLQLLSRRSQLSCLAWHPVSKNRRTRSVCSARRINTAFDDSNMSNKMKRSCLEAAPCRVQVALPPSLSPRPPQPTPARNAAFLP